MAGCTKMPLGMELGLSPGEFVLDGDPAPPQKRGRSPLPIFGPCLLWPNIWIDQDGTWHGGGPWSRPHCARWGTNSPPLKRGQSAPPIFGPFLLSPNGWMDKDGSRHGSRPQPRRLYARWGPRDPAPLSQKGTEPPNFRPIFIVAKRLDGSRWHLVWR